MLTQFGGQRLRLFRQAGVSLCQILDHGAETQETKVKDCEKAQNSGILGDKKEIRECEEEHQ